MSAAAAEPTPSMPQLTFAEPATRATRRHDPLTRHQHPRTPRSRVRRRRAARVQSSSTSVGRPAGPWRRAAAGSRPCAAAISRANSRRLPRRRRRRAVGRGRPAGRPARSARRQVAARPGSGSRPRRTRARDRAPALVVGRLVAAVDQARADDAARERGRHGRPLRLGRRVVLTAGRVVLAPGRPAAGEDRVGRRWISRARPPRGGAPRRRVDGPTALVADVGVDDAGRAERARRAGGRRRGTPRAAAGRTCATRARGEGVGGEVGW